VGFNNSPMPWSELERRLSGTISDKAATSPPEWANGGDGPAWSRKRSAYVPPEDLARRPAVGQVPYAELHCHTNFSFLDGASHPEELAEEAARLGLEALAVTDHDGFYGVVRFAEAARAVGLPTVFGAEVTLSGPVAGDHLVVLARGPRGYARLARSVVIAAREEEYVHAARSLGAGDGRLMLRHVLPATVGALTVQATLGIGFAILSMAGLSFLGLGVQPPTSDWGEMLSRGRRFLPGSSWLLLYPGAAISLTVLAFNLLGDGLRDAFDPRDQAG